MKISPVYVIILLAHFDASQGLALNHEFVLDFRNLLGPSVLVIATEGSGDEQLVADIEIASGLFAHFANVKQRL